MGAMLAESRLVLTSGWRLRGGTLVLTWGASFSPACLCWVLWFLGSLTYQLMMGHVPGMALSLEQQLTEQSTALLRAWPAPASVSATWLLCVSRVRVAPPSPKEMVAGGQDTLKQRSAEGLRPGAQPSASLIPGLSLGHMTPPPRVGLGT